MVDLQKKPFTTLAPSITTYNYTDIIDGTGVLEVYGGIHQEESTAAYYMSQQVDYSNDITTTDSFADGRILDKDFDMTFNTPRDIKGKIRIIMCIGGKSGTGSGSNTLYGIAKFRKWDGTTETEIADAQSEAVAIPYVSPAGAVVSKIINFEIDAPLTHFAENETLRITLELWGSSTGGRTTSTPGWGNDPKGRDDESTTIESDQTTVMKFKIPFILPE